MNVESLSVKLAIKKISLYLKRDDMRPYFVIADDATTLAEFQKTFEDFERIYVSEFCTGDALLDSDLLIEKLQKGTENALCFGLGEYVYFSGQEHILSKLYDKNLERKMIFICRGIANLLENLSCEDGKFRANRLCKIEGKSSFDVVKYKPSLNRDTYHDLKRDFETDAKNFSELLRLLEREQRTTVSVKSELQLQNVREINSFYEAIKSRKPNLEVADDALSEEQWREYFFDDNCENYPAEHWRTFAASFTGKISGEYLQYVATHSANYDEYRKNLFFALLDIDDGKIFWKFYQERKKILRGMNSAYLGEYLARLAKLSAASDVVRYLTDNTLAERRAMIQAVQGQKPLPAMLRQNYRAMDAYLTEYDFGDTAITKYFQRYKQIKVSNVLDNAFVAQVEAFAKSRPYNKFATRQAVLDSVNRNSKLYWLDALGVEFLGCIIALASQAELTAKITVDRAELPTLTELNKEFYEEWSGDKFKKNSKLDELKHAKARNSAPLYISEELEIIAETVTEIKNSLSSSFKEFFSDASAFKKIIPKSKKSSSNFSLTE